MSNPSAKPEVLSNSIPLILNTPQKPWSIWRSTHFWGLKKGGRFFFLMNSFSESFEVENHVSDLKFAASFASKVCRRNQSHGGPNVGPCFLLWML